VIASIEEPALIERILARVRPAAEDEEPAPFAARAPSAAAVALIFAVADRDSWRSLGEALL
jgi:hypothetical protein